MADDGLSVNFDIPSNFDTFVKPAAKVSGGRWTERRKVKRLQQRRTQKSAGKEKNGTGEFDIAETVPDKGTEGVEESSSGDKPSTQNSRPAKRKRDDNSKTTYAPPGTRNGEFVSSLWTSNPESKTAVEVQEPEDTEKHAPSNAPLADGSDTFTTLGLSPILANHLTTKLSLKAPTAIQRSAIPELISGDSDAFVQAETGSGKTLTYLLPIIDRIMRISSKGDDKLDRRRAGLFAIILVPTRELSRQILTVLESLVHCKNGPHWIVPGYVIGGEKKKSEKARLRKGLNVLVATPGRLLDHLEHTESLDVSGVRWLVLDEGDRLMELGFEETLNKILDILDQKSKLSTQSTAAYEESLPERRVTMLCSATMKTNVQRLGERSLREALYIKAEKSKEEGEHGYTSEDSKFSAPAQLRQSYVVVPAKLRLVALNAILQRAFIRQTATPKIIVFFSCTDSVDFHFEVFARKPEPTDSKDPPTRDPKPETDGKKKPAPPNPAVSAASFLHSKLLVHKLYGSLSQSLRTSTLSSFVQAKIPAILFCTDVAARGLDLPNVDLIVQFDAPFSPDDHLHRIGRTARAGRDGKAIIFLLPGAEEGYVDAVLKKGIREGQLVRSDLDEVVRKGFGAGAKPNPKQREIEDIATEWQLDVERWVTTTPNVHDLAKKAWGSHIRAYTTHVGAEKSIFSHKNLHYGHLAKSFGLRDKPADIKVPTNTAAGASALAQKAMEKVGRPGEGKGRKRKLEKDDIGDVGGDEAMKRMQKMARAMEKMKGMASEFNIG